MGVGSAWEGKTEENIWGFEGSGNGTLEKNESGRGVRLKKTKRDKAIDRL